MQMQMYLKSTVDERAVLCKKNLKKRGGEADVEKEVVEVGMQRGIQLHP